MVTFGINLTHVAISSKVTTYSSARLSELGREWVRLTSNGLNPGLLQIIFKVFLILINANGTIQPVNVISIVKDFKVNIVYSKLKRLSNTNIKWKLFF